MSKLKTLVFRGNLIESYHEIKCFIGSFKGYKILSTNNISINSLGDKTFKDTICNPFVFI